MSGGPYGRLDMQKRCVKKAEKASRLFYFEKKEMRFFQNNNDNDFIYKTLAGMLVPDLTTINTPRQDIPATGLMLPEPLVYTIDKVGA